MSGERPEVLNDYLQVLRRQWLVIAIATVIGALGGFVAVEFMPKTYAATSSVALNPTPADAGAVVGGRTLGQINLDTEAQIVKSTEVVEGIRRELGGASPGQLPGKIDVAVPPNTSVMNLTFRAGDATLAQQGSIATAEAYLRNRRAVSESSSKTQADGFKASVAELDKQIRCTRDEGPRSRLLETRAQLIGQVATIEAQRITPGRIITRAPLPRAPESPQPTLVITSLTALGFLLGLLLAFVRDRRSGKIRTRRDVERIDGAEVVADPTDPQGPGVAVLLRRIATAAGAEQRGPRVVALSDLGTGASAEALSRQMAQHLLESGHRSTVLAPWSAETDPNSPLATAEQVRQAEREGRLSSILRQMAQPDVVVLVALPAAHSDAEGLAVASAADVNLVVARVGQDTVSELRTALAEFRGVGAPVRGVILESQGASTKQSA